MLIITTLIITSSRSSSHQDHKIYFLVFMLLYPANKPSLSILSNSIKYHLLFMINFLSPFQHLIYICSPRGHFILLPSTTLMSRDPKVL